MSSLGSASTRAAVVVAERRSSGGERSAPPFGKSVKGNEGYNALMRGDTIIVGPKSNPGSIMAIRVVNRSKDGEYATDTVHLRPHGVEAIGAGRSILRNENLIAATSERTNILQVVTRGSQDASVLHGDSHDARSRTKKSA